MRRDLSKAGFVCLCWICCVPLAVAQSIAFSPPAPTTGELVTATLTEPFNCAAPQPSLKAISSSTLTFESILPNGIVNCPFIPSPPPTTSSFRVSLGLLSPGTYAVTWNIYLNQSQGAPTLLSSTSGSVVVTPAVSAMMISPGITGHWFDPGNSGHGFSIEVLPGDVMLAEWYVFAPAGGQAWIVATGPITGDTAVLQGYYPAGPGGRFPPDLDPMLLQNQFWGTVAFTFTGCNTGQVSWLPMVAGYTSGAMPITRLTMPAGLSCP